MGLDFKIVILDVTVKNDFYPLYDAKSYWIICSRVDQEHLKDKFRLVHAM